MTTLSLSVGKIKANRSILKCVTTCCLPCVITEATLHVNQGIAEQYDIGTRCRPRLKCDGTRAETRFRLTAFGM